MDRFVTALKHITYTGEWNKNNNKNKMHGEKLFSFQLAAFVLLSKTLETLGSLNEQNWDKFNKIYSKYV